MLLVLLAVLLIGAGAVFWWISDAARKDPVNQSDAYAYLDNGTLYWFKPSIRKGKAKGKYFKLEIKEESGKEPFLEENNHLMTGKTTQKGYEFKVKDAGIFDAWFSGEDLIVQKQGEKDRKTYKAVSEEELDEYINTMQERLQAAIDQSEEKEKLRLKHFFSQLKSVYGYLYFSENETFLLFIKIDEALLEGELAGSLLVMERKGEINAAYKEAKYDLNGITDGKIVEFYTTVDGKTVKLEGDFHEEARSFDFSYWETDEKLMFLAVTEEEFNQRYKEFKTERKKSADGAS